MSRFPGRKALHYHNITPPHFFSPRTPHYEMTSRGYAQLDRIAGTFDLVIGDSRYNLLQYARHLPSPRPSLCLYPVVDACEIRAAAWDRWHADRLRHESDGPIWLFVGRFAPNKRQDQVMLAFEEFVSASGRGRLLMIGDTTAVPAYVEQLEGLRARLRHGSRMTLMPSVTDEVLRASYRVADLFVCASEHEGFCLPLAEAMVFGVPTIALDRGAVAETLGHTAAIVRSWDPAEVAVLAADIVESPARRSAITASQHDRLRAFSPDAVREGLRAAVAFLRDGIELPDAGGCQPAQTAAITGELWSTSMN
jgi:glycosyltransferase involved in cell wall biosynthesis